jgi:hypothetical protein
MLEHNRQFSPFLPFLPRASGPHHSTYFMCCYHDFYEERGEIDGHLTKLLRSTLYIFPPPVLMANDGQKVNNNKAFSQALSPF